MGCGAAGLRLGAHGGANSRSSADGGPGHGHGHAGTTADSRSSLTHSCAGNQHDTIGARHCGINCRATDG